MCNYTDEQSEIRLRKNECVCLGGPTRRRPRRPAGRPADSTNGYADDRFERLVFFFPHPLPAITSVHT